MPVYHRTRRLQIYGDKPEVTTLFGNRYQMVVRCEAKHDTEAWYNSNKSQIFADFGTLYDAEMAIDGIEPRTGEAYDNMVLVSNEASYKQTGEYVVTFVYQTLTADFVQEAADKVDYELNGLRRVTRPLIAKDGSDYYNVPDAMVVEGAGTTAVNGIYLRDGDNQTKPKYVIEGGDPTEPVNTIAWTSSLDLWIIAEEGYSSDDNVATPDLAETWNPDDGITVRRATWADIDAAGIDPATVPVLSGSEKVIGTSTISHTEHGYDTETLTLASAVEDAKGPNEGGYVRIVETWVESGILSVSTPKVGGQQRVQVQAFNLSEATVVSEVSEVTASHELIDITTSDVDGIPTRNFTFEVDDFEVLSATESGLKQLTRTELSSTNFTRGTIGTDTYESLTLAGEEIDNDGIIKRRVSRWVEAGVLSRSIRKQNNGALMIETVEAFNDTPTASTGGVNIGEDVSNVEGIPTRRYTFAKGEGQIQVSKRPASPSLAGAIEVTVVSYGTAVPLTGVLIAESETEEDGYIRYTKTALQGNITGIKQTYKDVVDVEVPGTVELATKTVSSGGESGTIAIAKETPRRSRRVPANVTVEIVTTPPDLGATAFDLGEISCSVMFTQASLKVGPGATVTATDGNTSSTSTGFVKNFSISARSKTYAGCYLSGQVEAAGLVDYVAVSTPVVNGNIITFNDTSSSVETKASGTGSTSAQGYEESGILRRRSRPILTALNTTTYYEVITWSV